MASVISTRCDRCEHTFERPANQAGSLQNCPACGLSTRIEGEHDPAWKLASYGARILLFLIVAGVFSTSGTAAGFATLIGGILFLLVIRLCL